MPTSESDQSIDLKESRRMRSSIQVIADETPKLKDKRKYEPRSPSYSPGRPEDSDKEAKDIPRKRRGHDYSRSDSEDSEKRRTHKKKRTKNRDRSESRSSDEKRNPRRRDKERSRTRREYHSSEEDYDDRRRRRRDRNEENYKYRKDKNDEGNSTERSVLKDSTQKNEEVAAKGDAPPQRKSINDVLTRAGGAYIPPGRLRLMQQNIEDKNSIEFQRIAWEALKKSIIGLVNKVNTSNIGNIVHELFNENVVRGRGVLVQSLMRAQVASPVFTNVYAALVAIVNTKLPKIGELLLRRLILQFRRAFKRNDKTVCINSLRFVAHLVNQNVAHELLGLEVLTLLLQNPTDDSVEVAVAFLKELGQKLTEVSPRGLHAVFERLRSILNESQIDKRVQYMIEVMFAIRKDGFKEHEAVLKDLDLVEEEEQITHLLRLDESGQTEDGLNVFKHDPEYQINEGKYKQIKAEILGEGSSDEESGEDEEDDDDEDDEEEAQKKTVDIIDNTETNLIALRRTIYLTIQSSLDYEECAHKMMRMKIKPGQEHEFCLMVIECCAQQRSYEKFYGLLAQRFCLLKKEYMDEYVKLFQEQYETIHRLDTNKLRNTAKLFGHLLYSDAIPWTVMQCIKLNEEDTTSSSRIFIKILFHELSEYMGLPKLNERLRDEVLAPYFEGLLPRDNPKNTRFAINFFTAIGLGGLTDDLREHLKNAPKMIMAQTQNVDSSDSSSSDSDSDSDSSSRSSSSSDSDKSNSDDSENSEESEDERKKGRKKSHGKNNERNKSSRSYEKSKSKKDSKKKHDR